VDFFPFSANSNRGTNPHKQERRKENMEKNHHSSNTLVFMIKTLNHERIDSLLLHIADTKPSI
jgi:hypothetical protein